MEIRSKMARKQQSLVVLSSEIVTATCSARLDASSHVDPQIGTILPETNMSG